MIKTPSNYNNWLKRIATLEQTTHDGPFELLVREQDRLPDVSEDGSVYVDYKRVRTGSLGLCVEIAGNYLYDNFRQSPMSFYTLGESLEVRLIHHDDDYIQKIKFPFLIIRPMRRITERTYVTYVYKNDGFEAID